MKSLLPLFSFFSFICLQAQEIMPTGDKASSRPVSQYTIKHWNMDTGLPNNAILDIEQTEDGYLWLATFNGLTRFDGIDFEAFYRANTPELLTDHISALLVDDRDQLWVGTNGGGLLKYYRGAFTSYKSNSVNGSIITAMAKGSNGVLWIGTRDGLLKFDNDRFEEVEGGVLDNYYITSLFQDQNERLWIGTTTQGLYVVDSNGITSFTTEHGLPSNSIYSVFVDSRDDVWVGTNRGVSLIGSGIENFDSYPNAPKGYVNDFLEDHEGNVWMGSSSGLYRFNSQFEKPDQNEEVGNHIIQSLFSDREKNIWAGTYRVGLSRLNQSKFLLFGELEGLQNEVVNVTYWDSTQHWVGTDMGLIKVENGEIESFMLDQRSDGNRIRDILRDSKGRLWICTYNGLVHFDGEQVVQKYAVKDGLSSNNIRRIVEDHQGNLWVGTANGLNRIESGKITNYDAESGLRDSFIMSLFVDNQGKLWVGTNGGGSYVYNGDYFEPVTSLQGSRDIVFNFTQDENGAIWISTNRGVLYHQDSTTYNITAKEGIVSNNIFQVILEEPGLAWLTSDRGIMRVSREDALNLIKGESEVLRNVRLFDRADGLRTGQITAASNADTNADGQIWFCTIKGVAAINGKNIPTNDLRAITKVTRVLTEDERFQGSEEILLPAGNRTLEVHYSGLSFSAPEKVKYKYKLENFDPDWVDAGSRRTAYYTNLPPGEYEFQVLAANNDGLWSEAPATIQLVQQAYFYQETWFLVLLVVLLIAFGAFLYYLRAMGLSRRNYQLARMVQERTRDLQYQKEDILFKSEELNQLNTVKDKLLSVISHDLRGPIAAISGLLGLLKSGHLSYHELMSQSNRLNTEVHNLTYLLDNLLNWSKTQMQGIKLNQENVSLHTVVEQNLKMVAPISDQKKISIFNRVPDSCYTYTDVNFLSLVIRNLLMNALKFTHERGEITITSEKQNGNVVVAVNDNGVGMTPEELDKLFNKDTHYSKMGTANEAGTGIGLLLCKEFVELDGGRIWAESKIGEGSSFKIQLNSSKAEAVDAEQNG
jgi:ligand-binding sensor domain-containing protein/signal transduction histidine kinase